jgi:hypothetical protein
MLQRQTSPRPIGQLERQGDDQKVGQREQDANFAVMSPKHSCSEYRTWAVYTTLELTLHGVLSRFLY